MTAGTMVPRTSLLRRSGLALALCLAVAQAQAGVVPDKACDAAALPQFADFAVAPETFPASVTLQDNTPFARKYHTRLADGLRDLPVNFAGHYVMITWGCGTTCLDGGMVDARTGQATPLSFLLDSFGSFEVEIEDPLLFHPDSHLVIMLGRLRSEDDIPRQYFFDWTGSGLAPLCHAPLIDETGEPSGVVQQNEE